MRLNLQKTYLLFTLLATLILIATNVSGQSDTTPKKRLRSPATVKGLVGGESHDSYVIFTRKGQVMTVQISWRREGENHAGFTISQSPSFFENREVGFGKASNKDRSWTGKVPKTRDYYIYVVAHPTAHYALKVTTK